MADSGNQNQEWYKTGWGILLILGLWPIFLLAYLTKFIWQRSWSLRTRILVISFFWGSILVAGRIIAWQGENGGYKCIGPDGKTLKISPEACEKFNNAWKDKTLDDSPQLISDSTSQPTLSVVNTKLSETPEEIIQQICNKYGGDNNCVYLKNDQGKWEISQVIEYMEGAFMLTSAKQNSRDFIFAMYATKVPIAHVTISNNYYAGKKYYRAGLGEDVAITQSEDTWTSNNIGPSIFYDFLKANSNGTAGDGKKSTYVETNID